ncbi:MAG: site-specific integrase [Candidatus Omnitrophica bacterium]|nr:site-specific integrase [Candidatus Omnitrophota bacterium]
MPKIKTIREDIISEKELRETINRARSNEIKVLIAILYLTGARISEVKSIRAKDIEIDEDCWYIEMITLKQRKKEWQIPIKRRLKLVREVLFEKIILPYLKAMGFKENEFIFSKTRQYYYKEIKFANPNMYPHLFRHTLATVLSERVDPYSLKEWFGWKKLETSLRYVSPKNAIENVYKKNKEILEDGRKK